MNDRIRTRIFSAVAEALGCFFLYVGTFVLLLVPRFPEESYLAWHRILYGVAPTVLSIALLTLAGWLWNRSGGAASLNTSVQRAFLVAIGLVALFLVGLIMVANLQGRIP